MTSIDTNHTPARTPRGLEARSRSWIPMTPKTADRLRAGGPRTTPRLTSASPMRLGRHRYTANGRRRRTPAKGRDRFIPDRSKMNMELCSASILSGEKRRREALARAHERRKLNDNGVTDSPPPPTPRREITPLQAEFNRRMKAALFDIPLDRLEQHRPSRVATTSASSSSSTSSGTRSTPSNLAYATLDELEAAAGGNASATGTQGSFSDDESSLLSFSSASSSTRRPRPRIEPFEHDQLHVLQRSAAKSSYGRSISMTGEVHTKDMKALGRIRHISDSPLLTLATHGLADDYYLNLISWSPDNILAIALGSAVYLYNPNSGNVRVMAGMMQDMYITSVAWSTVPGMSNHLAIAGRQEGTSRNYVHVWDAEAFRPIETIDRLPCRVTALAWNPDHQWLSATGSGSDIVQYDARCSANVVSRFTGHSGEVCGLKWSPDGSTLASGGNDDLVCIWDAAMSARSPNRDYEDTDTFVRPRLFLTEHKAAVKALAWCPFKRNVLASGGGTADKTIKFWSSQNGALLNSVDTGSQVTSLLWSPHQHQELLSSHGYHDNQLTLWNVPTMTKMKEFKTHTERILSMDISPEGKVVSLGSDERLCFWDMFGPSPKKASDDIFEMGPRLGMHTIH